MGNVTEIAWTDATWNPWQGCHKLSPACANCYMFRDKKRYGQDPTTVVRSSEATFNKPLVWAKNREKYGHIQRVFTCSWSDFFIEEADPWRMEAWEIIARTPQFEYQILTKRPERIQQCLPNFETALPGDIGHARIGITAENQRCLDARDCVWATFLSIEPMLGPIELPNNGRLEWVICGCESGPNARPTNIEWVRSLRDQCATANIPFFLKQLVIDGKLVSTPELDGRRHVEFPGRKQP